MVRRGAARPARLCALFPQVVLSCSPALSLSFSLPLTPWPPGPVFSPFLGFSFCSFVSCWSLPLPPLSSPPPSALLTPGFQNY